MVFFGQFAGWGAESVWGTAATRTQFSRAQKGTLVRSNRPREPGTEVGFRDIQRMRDKLRSGEGKLIVPLAFDEPGFDVLLEHCFGLKSGAGTSVSPWVFTLDDAPFTRAASPLVGLTVEAGLKLPTASNESMILEGGRVTEFGADFAVDEIVNLDVDLIGEDAVTGVETAAPTFPDLDTNELTTQQVTVEIDDAVTSVVNTSFRCNNNLRTDRAFLGSPTIAAPLAAPGRRQVTGSIGKEWEDQTLYDLFVNKTPAKLEVIATDGTHTWTWLFPQIVFTGESPEMEEGEALPQELPFTAQDDATDGVLKLTMNDQP